MQHRILEPEIIAAAFAGLAFIACHGPATPSREADARAPGTVESPDAVSPTVNARPGVPEPRAGRDRLGQPAPTWDELTWLGPQAPSPDDLRGKVVLIRWWTDTCPFCRSTAPALRELDRRYRDRGLVVIGMYHPKPRGTPVDPARVRAQVEHWAWTFPVAIDADWSLLDRYWLRTGDRDATSVSFLVDRQGTIRYVHPGPEFHDFGPDDDPQARRDHADLVTAIEALLAAPPPDPRSNP